MSLRHAVPLLLALGAMPAAAQPAPSWAELRCGRYTAAWSEALARFGRAGLGAVFLERHEAFIRSGCRERLGVCPRSTEELAIADAVTVAAINAGATGSFLPFACRD
jgi:hypothetical protein